jgi:hypothetical protein
MSSASSASFHVSASTTRSPSLPQRPVLAPAHASEVGTQFGYDAEGFERNECGLQLQTGLEIQRRVDANPGLFQAEEETWALASAAERMARAQAA